MNRNVLIFVTLIITAGLMACNIFQSKVAEPEIEVAVTKPAAGCGKCHPTLSDVVPEDHAEIHVNEVMGCLGCHAKEGANRAFEVMMHQSHFAVLDKEMICDACHRMVEDGRFHLIGAHERHGIQTTQEEVNRMQSYYLSWAVSDYLDHQHARQNITCSGCHEKSFPQEQTSMDSCLACHGTYEQVTDLTQDMTPNPHDSHMGEIRCTLCHKGHEESVLYCNQCHEFDI